MPAETPLLPLVAIVAERERDLVLAAANRLSLCLGEGGPPGWPIRIRFVAPDAALPEEPAAAILASLALDAERSDTPFAPIAAGWRRRVAGWSAAGRAPVLIVNLFRYVADPARRHELAEHLRRLNLLAVALSRESGAGVVDIDRSFALIGGRTLGTDYRGQGAFAIEVAAHGIVAAILGAGGLDGRVPDERLAAAEQRNGGRAALAAILARHMARAA